MLKCVVICSNFLLGVVYPLEITASYTTSFRCFDGSYALIGGADLTLEYDYGYSYTEVKITFYYPPSAVCGGYRGIYTDRCSFVYNSTSACQFLNKYLKLCNVQIRYIFVMVESPNLVEFEIVSVECPIHEIWVLPWGLKLIKLC